MRLGALYIYIIFYIASCYAQLKESTSTQVKFEDNCNFTDNVQLDTIKLLSKQIPPKLDGKSKGDAGKIGVIAGSIEHTGAPYFSAITSLKVGADIIFVISSESASPIIKSYTPDLIVFPYFDVKYVSKIRSLLPRLDVIVIGPGLGRGHDILHLMHIIIEDCKALGKPLIIDADGVYLISKNASVLKDYPCPGVIMTPNQREANQLIEAVSSNSSHNWYKYWGDCVSVLVKGENDNFLTNVPNYTWRANEGGSGRRVFGQGDILSGALGTFYNWALKADLCKTEYNTQLAQSIASYAAAKLTRLCNYKAFMEYGRSMTATDMIKMIHSSFNTIFSTAE